MEYLQLFHCDLRNFQKLAHSHIAKLLHHSASGKLTKRNGQQTEVMYMVFKEDLMGTLADLIFVGKPLSE